MVNVLLEYIKYQVHNKYDDCFIRVLTSMVSVLLEYGECFIRVLTSMVSVLLEYIDLY